MAVGVAVVTRVSQRLLSIDIVRGAVMVLMALDHVRLYLTYAQFDPTDLSRTTVWYFLARWITHFCAPGFVFLAGSAAFLHGERLDNRSQLSRFLLTRGLWLVIVELTVMRFSWTFNFDYGSYVLAGVIWMIGWCMVLMAALVRLPLVSIAAFGLLVIGGHNLVDPWMSSIRPAVRASQFAPLLQILYFGGPVSLFDSTLAVLFSIFPWIGVMATGYAFGRVLRLPENRRNRACLWIGFGAIALFVLLRGFNLYGNPRPWTPQSTMLFSVLAMLNTAKYPASLAFLLMTLGPMIAMLPLLEKRRGRAASVLAIFGRTPFFYYVLHIPLIHLVAVALSYARYGRAEPWLFLNHPLMVSEPPPAGWGYNLATIYLITALVTFLLYWPCRWFAELKRRRTDPWLSYL
jgi:uncharacterized membrane protein